MIWFDEFVNKIKELQMQVILDILITGKKKKGFKNLKKVYDSINIPTKDCLIEDSAWKEAREITNIIINYDEEYCIVSLVEDIDNYEIDEKLKMYKGHNWGTYN